jgi:hypothetical protein
MVKTVLAVSYVASHFFLAVTQQPFAIARRLQARRGSEEEKDKTLLQMHPLDNNEEEKKINLGVGEAQMKRLFCVMSDAVF